MSDFNLPEPNEAEPSAKQDFNLPEGLEPNANDIATTNKSKKWIWIVVIVLLVILCCCCVVVVAILTSEEFDVNHMMNNFSAIIQLGNALL